MRDDSTGRRRSPQALLAPSLLVPVAAVTAAAAAALGGYAWNNSTYADREVARARRFGVTEVRWSTAAGTELNIAVGPDNGPPVLLLHGQGADWQSYARVLPDLARNFHVHAVDIAGHGRSARTPGRYRIDAISGEIIDLIDRFIGGPVLLSGHSSGGLIAARIAASTPDRVRGLLLEDPPLFSTDPDRMPRQFNYVDLARPAHEFLAQDPLAADTVTDFASWYIAHNGWIGYFGSGRDGIVRYAQRYRRTHPDRPLRLWFLPPTANEAFAGMHRFDPEFADAFYDGSWVGDLDQAAMVGAIEAPTILVHADWRVTDAGILEGAMTDDDAERAGGLLRRGRVVRVATGHGFHFENPRRFVELVREVAIRAA